MAGACVAGCADGCGCSCCCAAAGSAAKSAAARNASAGFMFFSPGALAFRPRSFTCLKAILGQRVPCCAFATKVVPLDASPAGHLDKPGHDILSLVYLNGGAILRTVRSVLAVAILAGGVAQALAASVDPARPWTDPELAPDARADLLDAQLTQDEELQLVHGYFGVKGGSIFSKGAPKAFQPQLRNTAGFVPGIPRLGIPPLVESDAGVGIADSGRVRKDDEATALASGLAMAATWNPSLAFSAGSVVGNEARDRAYNVVLAGAMNLAREPRGGRTFEYAGEDPLLAGTMAGAEVAGVESAHVVSTVKHLALNDQENGRMVLSA